MGEGLDLLGILLRRKWLIALGAVVGLGLGILYYSRQPTVYQSAAQMLIQEKNSSPLPIEGFEDQLFSGGGRSTNHPTVISSPLIVGQAVTTKDLRSLPSLATSQSPAAAIRRGLSVSTLKEAADVLAISFQGPSPDDCQAVVNAVMDTYQDFLGETKQSVGQETAKLIRDAKDELFGQLSTKKQAYAQFRQDTPLIYMDGQATNVHQQRRIQIETQRSQLMLQNSQLQARIGALEEALQREGSLDALLLMAGQTGEGVLPQLPSANGGDGNLFALLLEEQTLQQKYGSNYPPLKAVRRKIQFAREFQQRTPPVDEPATDIQADTRHAVETYLQSLREQLATGVAEKKQLDELFDVEEKAARKLAEYVVKDATFVDDIGRTETLFDAVVARLEEISLVEDYGGYSIQVLSPAERGSKVAPIASRILLASVVLGLMGGFGLGYVAERFDKTFHSPHEVGQFLRLPMVGHIPQLPTDKSYDSPLAPILCTVHRPKSPLAEAFRAVRTALYFSTRGKDHQVIQVTSPTPGDGKSTVSANLAVTIAHSGKRVLLMDADFRRPTQQKLFSLEGPVGLASVVDGKAEPPQAIRGTEVENLYVMPCGPRPHNPSELLTSPQFQELLQLMRDQFDFVIVDTPPVLAVTDATAVAARVDGVLLTLRIRKDVKPNALRARDVLLDVGADVVGVVVNGADQKKGYGYGYGYGQYRDKYAYGYGQDESSNGKQIAGYYDNDEEGEERVTGDG